MLPARRQPDHGGGPQGPELAQDGLDGVVRPLCQDLLAIQRPEDRQEEDPRQEAHAEPCLQRVLRFRVAPPRGGPQEHQSRVHAPRLGQGDEE